MLLFSCCVAAVVFVLFLFLCFFVLSFFVDAGVVLLVLVSFRFAAGVLCCCVRVFPFFVLLYVALFGFCVPFWVRVLRVFVCRLLYF